MFVNIKKATAQFAATIGLACWLFPFGVATADVLYDESVAQEFSNADLVVEAKVVGVAGKCSPSSCDTLTYDLAIAKKIFRKQPVNATSTDQSSIAVCAQSRLGIGQRYVFFLYRVPNPGRDDPNTPIDESVGDCTYAANFGAIFLNYAGDYFRIGSPEASTLVTDHGVEYLTIGKRQDTLLEELNRLVKQQEAR